ncbi:NmrA/HSCARG family protein [Haloarcula sp. 1CSR25-25]|uniref:NmrA/HSCARG family protein n=1 Tax=Haloarcula sp. 1CSR25-25 TaxID=2862545 RepID=UPI0028955B76|nr:NmrA/HSCARG family protein [Haloarcula sp. 1CSR25-25]MDT3434217.1 NmrA/HSCARG family protein [Haloarcula sp. 1CSR25-25]
MRNILVTGATGTQGGAVVDYLLADSEQWEIYGLTRDATSDAAEALEARGVTVVEGDMTDADRMQELVDGMDAVYSVTTFMEHGTDVEVEQGVTLAEAAADAGVDHFVYSSVGSADADTGLPHFESKWAVEQRIEELGLPATVVRPVFFMQNFAYMMREDIMDGQLVMPLNEGVSLAVVDATDIGQTVVAALSDPEAFLGEVVTLAGDDLTVEKFAAAFGDQLGHEVEPVHADVEDYREMAGDEMADMFQWFNDVGYDIDIPALAEWGIETTSFEAYLADSEMWQPTAAAAGAQ